MRATLQQRVPRRPDGFLRVLLQFLLQYRESYRWMLIREAFESKDVRKETVARQFNSSEIALSCVSRRMHIV